jgi:hypothetical protein
MEDGFHLGREVDPEQLRLPSEEMVLGSPFYVSPRDLLTHVIVLGMTGCGKTVLGKIMIEEAALQGIPSIIVDPKGDLASMELVFPSLAREDFVPWVEARRGEKKEHAALRLSKLYKNKLTEFDVSKERIEAFDQKTKVVVLTPRSKTGVPLAISSLPSPPPNVKALMKVEPETVLDLIDTIVRALIMRLFPREAPEKHRTEEKLLDEIIRYAWENGIPLEGIDGLATLVGLVENPPLEKIGVMEVDRYILPRDRHELAININNLLVGVEKLWHVGIPLDIDFLLEVYSRDGKTPIIIFSLSEITSLEDKVFVVSRIAYAVYEWMRRKGGSGEPRLCFYVDEIGGGGGKTAFFPIHPYNPPSKPPLMLLIKQGRAFGICCVFTTQNPGDIDYKGLGNCGTWIIGKLSTRRDREKVLQGLGDIELLGTAVDRRKLERQIASLETGEFVCKTKRGDLEFFKERWLMSYHKTLTSKEIREVTDERDRRNAASLLLMPTKRAFLKLNHPASLEETRRHFRRDIEIHVKKAECNYMPLLSFNVKTGFRKRHPFLSKEVKTDLAYGPMLVPLFKEKVDLNYVDEVLGLEKTVSEDLLEAVEDAAINIASRKLPVQTVFDEISTGLIEKIKQEIADRLDDQIGIEREKKIDTEKLDFKPKLDELDFEIQTTRDQMIDYKGEMSRLEEELSDLRRDKAQRKRLDEPIVMITKSIASRQRRINRSKARLSKLQRRIDSFDSQKKRVLDSHYRKIEQLKEQFDTVRKEILEKIEPKLTFEETLVIFVPICSADVGVKNHEKNKTIHLEWNGYNGVRVTSFSCHDCGTAIDRFLPLNICLVCLGFLCEEHAQICAECGKIICREHSWLCDCGRVHCVSEEQTKCKECNAPLCSKCKFACKICGASLCSNHVYSCAACGKNVCKAHSWVCGSCGNPLCGQERSYTCSVGQHLICEDCRLVCDDCGENLCGEHSVKCETCGKTLCNKESHATACAVCGRLVCNSCLVTCEGCGKPLCSAHYVECPNCGKLVCRSCLRTEKRFLGLVKKQKCVICR